MMRASPGSMARKSCRIVWRASLADRPGHLDPGRPAADHTNVMPGRAAVRVGFAFRPLERGQHAAADLGRVLDRLEPGGEARPLVVPEVGVVRAGGDDERVERDRAAVRR